MNTLNKHLKENKFSTVYLLLGEEDYLRKSYEGKLKNALISDDLNMNYTYYEGKNIDVNEVVDKARTLPFFNDRRLIIVENSEFFSTQNVLSDNISTFPETTYLVFVEKKVDKRNKLYKQVKKLGTVVELRESSDKDLTKWIAVLLNKDNKKITTQNANYLLDKIGPEMFNIKNEVEKLVTYTRGRDIITKEDIDEIGVGQIENEIFQMIDAITEKNIDRALNLYYDLLELKEEPRSILRLLSRQFKILIQVKDLTKQGLGNKEIGSKVGIHPYYVGKYISQGKKLSMKTLIDSLNLCNETEADLNRGNQTDQLGVEILIIQFTS